MAVKTISEYVEGLIPTVEKPVMVDVPVMDYGRDGRGNTVEVQRIDKKGMPMFKSEPAKNDDGTPKTTVSPAFTMTKGYTTIRNTVDSYFAQLSVYWDARSYAVENTKDIDEVMFDKMNDYLWRHIMAVKYPQDMKREFKHLAICVKRKLYYLGDRNDVFNQTIFGLYDNEIGGTGKTTLLEGFSRGFSNGTPLLLHSWEELFGFNFESFDKYGMAFIDEDPPTDKTMKDMIKQFADSENRKVERKGKDHMFIRNLLTLCCSANHKIGSRIFDDEARGQRRDAFFEVIGNLIQYTSSIAEDWFKRMFAYCPIDDDSKTYHHSNPHSSELTDGEVTILNRIYKTFKPLMASYDHDEAERVLGVKLSSPNDPKKPVGYKLGMLFEMIDGKPNDKIGYTNLKKVLKVQKLFTLTIDHANGKWYMPNLDEIGKVLDFAPIEAKQVWTQTWARQQPFLDVDSVVEMLKGDYDYTSPITYEEVK